MPPQTLIFVAVMVTTIYEAQRYMLSHGSRASRGQWPQCLTCLLHSVSSKNPLGASDGECTMWITGSTACLSIMLILKQKKIKLLYKMKPFGVITCTFFSSSRDGWNNLFLGWPISPHQGQVPCIWTLNGKRVPCSMTPLCLPAWAKCFCCFWRSRMKLCTWCSWVFISIICLQQFSAFLLLFTFIKVFTFLKV